VPGDFTVPPSIGLARAVAEKPGYEAGHRPEQSPAIAVRKPKRWQKNGE